MSQLRARDFFSIELDPSVCIVKEATTETQARHSVPPMQNWVHDAWVSFEAAEDQRILAMMRQAAASLPTATDTTQAPHSFVIDSLGLCDQIGAASMPMVGRSVPPLRGRTQQVAMLDEVTYLPTHEAPVPDVSTLAAHFVPQSSSTILANLRSAIDAGRKLDQQTVLPASNPDEQPCVQGASGKHAG